MLLIAMTLLRGGLDLGQWLSLSVFNNLGLLFLAMAMFWGYFTFAEHLTVWYANEPAEARIFWDRATGSFSTPFWFMITVNFVIPMLVLPFRWGRRPVPISLVSAGVLVGMWLERFLIVVPSLSLPRLAYTIGEYAPTWVELAIAIGSLGAFVFLYLAFTQLAPIVSIWEIREGEAVAHPSGARCSSEVTSDETTAGNAPGGHSIEAAFEGESELASALDKLAEQGISGAAVEVRSSIPLSFRVPGDKVRSRIHLAAIAGGLLGGTSVYLLASLTAKAYPIFTGHMALVPAPPTGIVTYEGVALGAVLSIFLAVLLEARLPRRYQRGKLDHHVADGGMVVTLSCSDDRRESVLESLAEAVEIHTG